MYLAGAKIILDFYGNEELRKKRSELEKLFRAVHKDFQVSITEVADFSDPERCVIGIALASSTSKGARTAIRKVVDHIDATAFARLVMDDVEILGLD